MEVKKIDELIGQLKAVVGEENGESACVLNVAIGEHIQSRFVPEINISAIIDALNELKDIQEFGRKLPMCGQVWKHFKGGVYVIDGIANHTERKDKGFVIYHLRQENPRAEVHAGQLWARPVDMFMSRVDVGKYPDVKQFYRFEHIG